MKKSLITKLKKRLVHILLFMVAIVVVTYLVFWGFSLGKYDVEFGVSYSPEYAEYLGLDSREAFEAIMTELNPPLIRLAAPWSVVEPLKDTYNFTEVDHMLNVAQQKGSKVVLVIGQKVPRWPECYIPKWSYSLSEQAHKDAVLGYVRTTVERYKNNPAIEYWQVENEPFIRFPFGECAEFDKEVIYEEVKLVKELDSSREIIITDSGEMSTWRRPSMLGDVFGTTLYRTVRTFNDYIIVYDWLPPAFYKLKALVWGNNTEHFFVAELQAEPWFAEGFSPMTTDYTNEKTFSPKRFEQNIEYSQKIGASRVYLWGTEWWYFMKEMKGDARYWEYAKQLFEKSER